MQYSFYIWPCHLSHILVKSAIILLGFITFLQEKGKKKKEEEREVWKWLVYGLFKSQYQHKYSPCCSSCISYSASWENMHVKQKPAFLHVLLMPFVCINLLSSSDYWFIALFSSVVIVDWIDLYLVLVLLTMFHSNCQLYSTTSRNTLYIL